MKLNKSYILFFVLIRICTVCNAQFIIAGSVGNNYYYDVNPDVVLKALNVHLSSYPTDSLKLDVDSDGVFDFKMQSYGGGGLGGGAGGCVITPLTSYAFVV